MTHYPPIPKTQAEWELHWDFYQLTVQQRDLAWREVHLLREEVQRLRREAFRERPFPGISSDALTTRTMSEESNPAWRKAAYPQHVSDGDDCV